MRINETTVNELPTTMLPLAQLRPSPTQPRKYFNEEAHNALTKSMRERGFTLSLLLVRPWPQNGKDGTPSYEIVSGERRVRAAIAAGIDRAPCIVRELNNQEVLEIQLIENVQCVDLTPMEEAEQYKGMLAMRDENDKPFYTYDSLANLIGKTAHTVQNKVSLSVFLEGDETRREVESGRLPPTTAMLIARIPDATQRSKAAEKILHPQHQTGPLSVKDAQELINREFTRDLGKAQFELHDATLLDVQKDEEGNRIAGGACTDCPRRELNAQRGQNPTTGNVKSGATRGICLNAACFESKQQRIWSPWQEENTDLPRKRRASTEEESRKLYKYGNQLAPEFDLVDLDERPDGYDLRAGEDCSMTWKRLTQGAELAVLVTKDRLGKTHELVDRLRAIEAARTLNKHDIFKTRQRAERSKKRAR